MVRLGQAEDGTEEWSCADCGRRMMLRWPPHYEMVILERGNENAVHVGGKGGLQVGGTTVEARPETVTGKDAQWLRDNGINWE